MENEQLIEKNEEMEEIINPSDIIFDDEEDTDMPTPETEDYNAAHSNSDNDRLLKPSYKFVKLFEDCLGKLPYASVLKNQNNEQIKLLDLMRFVEAKTDQMTVGEMNTIISFLAQCPVEVIRPLMEIIEDQKRQPELWTLLN